MSLSVVTLLCSEDRAQLAADVKTLKAAHNKALLDARTAHTTRDIDVHQETGVDQPPQSGDWVKVDKKVSPAGSVDIATLSTTELELKRRADKLSSMITEVSVGLLPFPAFAFVYNSLLTRAFQFAKNNFDSI